MPKTNRSHKLWRSVRDGGPYEVLTMTLIHLNFLLFVMSLICLYLWSIDFVVAIHQRKVLSILVGLCRLLLYTGLIVSFYLGFYGCLHENRRLLQYFRASIPVLFLAFLVLVGIHFVPKMPIFMAVGEQYFLTAGRPKIKKVTSMINEIQMQYDCCGWDQPSDYENNLPVSCCQQGGGACNNSAPSLRTSGCKDKMNKVYRSVHGINLALSGVILAVGIIQFVLASAVLLRLSRAANRKFSRGTSVSSSLAEKLL